MNVLKNKGRDSPTPTTEQTPTPITEHSRADRSITYHLTVPATKE